jgi:hypothetical protein
MHQSGVIVVSGLPRSGTSLMMKMLEAGGLQVLTDGIRRPDVDNPQGYYEFEGTKKLRNGDDAWLADAQGKVVKVISELLKWLPPDYNYRVIFMRRNMDEVLASQREMLSHKGIRPSVSQDERLATLYQKHVDEMTAWLEQQRHMEVVYVNYGNLLSGPAEAITRLNGFLGGSLDTAGMAAVVDPALYRHRAC